MDSIRNPFVPGAGSPPVELASRDALVEDMRVELQHARIGRHAKSAVLVGLRGVGKTVLLYRIRGDVEAQCIHTIHIEAPEGRPHCPRPSPPSCARRFWG